MQRRSRTSIPRRVSRSAADYQAELEVVAKLHEQRARRCPIASMLQDRVWTALENELDAYRRTQLEDLVLRLSLHLDRGLDVDEHEAAVVVATLIAA
jgi:hypothetical protein